MTGTNGAVAAAVADKPPRLRRVKQAGGPGLTQDASRQAKQVAASIFEVLAGARTPQQAAEALAVSLPRYYQLESRALPRWCWRVKRGPRGACVRRPAK